jgi:hypothetical protein
MSAPVKAITAGAVFGGAVVVVVVVVVAGAVAGTRTDKVTVFVLHVAVVQFGVPSFVKIAKFGMTWPLVSLVFTVTWNDTVTVEAAGTLRLVQVIVPPLSEAVQPVTPPQVAELAT